MLRHPQFDPVAISVGPLKVHWYGLTYLVGFLVGWWLGRLRTRKPWSPLNEEQMGDLLFYIALGVILGGRFGYVVFYNFDQFLADPLWLFRVWEGGMAFHGGLLGVMVAMWWYARKIGRTFFELADFVAPLVPVGLGAGRIGNFINGELWGRPTDVPWGMVFPQAPDLLARHPSQLYQFALEGVALFIALWWFSSRKRPTMAVSGLFLVLYGCFRILVEFVRQPDAQLGYLAFDWLTMGQLLSLPMILAGLGLIVFAYRRNT
ncbi:MULTISPECIES: prolipoprotein diacylglyceryl transferase [Marinobacter]|uniref:Phosphatidylglycerol--prolipoprotein diacylglyceryl transferase n=1 Tax=Marinobacter xestospongiae TaxID=994319 RepID=A0ABU3VU07_9GAMM|nr:MULTISPECIES: prolipoprotein diacylglyceryl transferase [Marinobacter]MCK7567598.1 prolipoprotein diacylglyceryl transferase [Marinobacter xestospongiae]MDV2077492.1 prolipoprotein diacylglyceryl transferase [Marinobacter xestospongiae]UDL04316.1 prolipoprotein diacylglyceryl transferase [Marinobacter sp. CA1]